ncbi:MAG: hypothetical protein OHK0050_29250 [Roseiflexaceae bacterium]|jgi:hypothetical protein
MQLDLTNKQLCLRSYLQLVALPDQRLGFVCSIGLKQQRLVYALVAYNWETEELSRLVIDDLPGNGLFSFGSTIYEGVFANTGAYSTLYQIHEQSIQPLAVTLTDDGRHWFLPDSISALAEMELNGYAHLNNHPVGLLHSPSVSSSSNQVAVWATLETIGQQYELRSYAWNLYLVDPISRRSTVLLKGVRDPTLLVWSHHGTQIAYSVGAGGTTTEGLWIYDQTTDKHTLLAVGMFNRVAWSANDEMVFAVRCRGLCGENDELLQFTLAQTSHSQ